MTPRHGVRAALLAACLAATSGASAQGRLDEARQHFEAGVRLLEDARYAEAAASLERSAALREAPSVLYNLALAYRGAGGYLRAIETLERYLAVAPAQEPLRRDATVIADELRRALGRVRLRARGAPTEVRVDERVVARGDATFTLPLDPGRHVFEARRPGYRTQMRDLRLAPGADEEVTLDVAAEPMPARLRVEVNAPEAEVLVDGVSRGRGGCDLELPAGSHALEVNGPGGATERRALELAPGTTERVVVTVAGRPSVFTRWWFWTGAAVLVAGLVVGGVVLFSGTEPPVPGTWGTAYGAASSPWGP